jgi:hypothetical protein
MELPPKGWRRISSLPIFASPFRIICTGGHGFWRGVYLQAGHYRGRYKPHRPGKLRSQNIFEIRGKKSLTNNRQSLE